MMSTPTQTMPTYWMELDDQSILRAITAVAEDMDLDPVFEERAHYIVGLVYAALDAAYVRSRRDAGLPVPEPPIALVEASHDYDGE
jgi:hypothetical protein